MSRTLPAATLAALYAQTTSSAYLWLLTISHSDFTTQRFVNNTANVTSNGNTYTKFTFGVIPPPDTEETNIRARLVLDNVGRDLVAAFRGVSGSRERISVAFALIDSADPDTVLISYVNHKITNLSYNALTIVCDLTIDNMLAEPFPGDTMTPATFPGLF